MVPLIPSTPESVDGISGTIVGEFDFTMFVFFDISAESVIDFYGLISFGNNDGPRSFVIDFSSVAAIEDCKDSGSL